MVTPTKDQSTGFPLKARKSAFPGPLMRMVTYHKVPICLSPHVTLTWSMALDTAMDMAMDILLKSYLDPSPSTTLRPYLINLI